MVKLLIVELLLLFMCLASTSSQKYSYIDKEYYFVRQAKTMDDAASFCKNRNESLVQIRDADEDNFISKTILEPADVVWLASTNEYGTRKFRWFDGSEMAYSNWVDGNPKQYEYQSGYDVRRGLVKSELYNGKWYENVVTGTRYILCQKIVFVLPSKLLQQKTYELDTSLITAISGSTTSQLNEYVKLIGEEKSHYDIVHDQLVELIQTNLNKRNSYIFRLFDFFNVDHETGHRSPNSVLRKLEGQADKMAFDVEFHKRQSNEVIAKLNSEVEKYKKLTEQLESEHALTKNQNEMLEVRLNRLEDYKLSNNRTASDKN